jgi:hypothetical protein
MAARANFMALGSTSDRLVRPVSETTTGPVSAFSGLIPEIRGLLGGRKVAEQLAAIIGCDVRSASRYLAGDRIPSADVMVILLTHPATGPGMIAYVAERARRELSPKAYETFRQEMAKAALRAFVRDNNDD